MTFFSFFLLFNFLGGGGSPPPGHARGCKKTRHYARNCPTLQCSNCNIKGDATENCRKKSKSGDCAKIPGRVIINMHLGFLTENMVMLVG